MDDIYSALIGAAPTKAERQKAIADMLRRRRAFGELGTVTGDQVLQSFGKGQIQRADDAAKELQDTRQADADDLQTQTYQSGQLNHMSGVLGESVRAQDMDDATTRRGQDMSLEEARLRAAAAGQSRRAPPRLRVSDIKTLQDTAQDIGSMEGLESFLGRGGKFGAVKVGKLPIPGARALSNTLASHGIGSAEMKETQMAKQEFDRLYTLGSRNRLFGATLTPNEKKDWENANPSFRQSDEQIAVAIPILRKVMAKRLENLQQGLIKEGYNAEAIGEYADIPGLNLPVGGEYAEEEGGSALSPTPVASSPPAVQPTIMTETQKRIAELKAKKAARAAQ